MKILFTILLIASFVFEMNAQTADLGTPKGWSSKSEMNLKTVIMPAFDLAQAKIEDDLNKDKAGLWRFGFEHDLKINFEDGSWFEYPNGDRIWRARIQSKDALSLNFVFSKFEMPDGGYLYIYPTDKSYYHKAYTSINNSPAKVLGTDLIKGDDVIIEYFEPATVSGQGILEIETVVHGYRSIDIFGDRIAKALNSSGDCNIDVLCPLGIGWENEINSVAMIVSGGGVCTGALVNNTTNDGTPYFLTANHCGFNASWAFRFNWISPTPSCATTTNSPDQTGGYDEANGAVLRSSSAASDFGLLELNASPASLAGFGVFYAGWDKTDALTVTQATGIHHPAGDIMKICRENNAPYHSNEAGADVWYIDQWEEGVTEGGSSGSPLFDQNHRVIGQLYGGLAACSGTSNNGNYDYYGRFGVSWAGGGSDATRLSNWLDPTGSNSDFIDGYDPNGSSATPDDGGMAGIFGASGTICSDQITPEVTIRNFGSNDLLNVDIVYNIDGGSNSTYSWTGLLAPNANVSVVLPVITVAGGAHALNVELENPNGNTDSDISNNVAVSNFTSIVNAQLFNLIIETDCYPDETSWDVYDPLAGLVLYSGGTYAGSNSGAVESEVVCLGPGCYTLRMYDSAGDGLQYSGCAITGDYYLLDNNQDTIVQMTAVGADFGSQADHEFCVGANNVKESNLIDMAVYPNPAGEQLNVLIPNNGMTYNYSLISVQGQLIDSGLIIGGVNQLDVSSVADGVYFLKVQNDGEASVRRVVIQ